MQILLLEIVMRYGSRCELTTMSKETNRPSCCVHFIGNTGTGTRNGFRPKADERRHLRMVHGNDGLRHPALLLQCLSRQVQDDILHYAWLVQIARLQNPDGSETDWDNAVPDSVTDLHHNGTIVVGNARDADRMVLIDPWQETEEDLRSRMASAIEETDADHRDFCFWIQLTEHFAR